MAARNFGLFWGDPRLLPASFGGVGDALRVVTEDRREPALGLLWAPVFAARVVEHLVAPDLAHAGIAAFPMCEIEARDGGRGPHGVALGQLQPGRLLGIQQREQRALLGMVGLGGITRGRPDAGIVF